MYIQFAIYKSIMSASVNIQSMSNAVYCKLHESRIRGISYVL